MPKATRSVGEIDAVRERILDYALKILVKNGYESLSMAKLGSKINMTAANIYNYYTNKDELLIAIHKKTYAMLYNKIRNAVKTADTPLQRVCNIITPLWNLAPRTSIFMMLCLIDQSNNTVIMLALLWKRYPATNFITRLKC